MNRLGSLREHLLLFFVSTTIVLPASPANKVIFIMLVGVLAVHIFKGEKVDVSITSPFLVSAIFLYGYLISFVSLSDSALANQFVLATLTLYLIFYVKAFNIDIDRVIKRSGLFMIIASTFFYLVLNNYIFSGLYEPILTVFVNNALGAFGERDLAGINVGMFHLGAVPFIYLPALLYFDEFIRSRSLLSLLVTLVMVGLMIMSSSRGLVLAFLMSASLVVIVRNQSFGRYFTFASIVVSGAIFLGYLLLETSLLSFTEYSNSVKIGHFLSYLEYMSLPGVLFGEGLGSYYFSSGINASVSHTEITFLDLVRYFGFPLSILMFIAFLSPTLMSRRLEKKGDIYVLIFLVYLLLSLTNPVLINSYGLIIVVWYWANTTGVKFPEEC